MAPTYDPKNMPFRRVGGSGLRLPLFSIGGWLTYGGTVKGDPVKEILTKAFDSGINFIDVAEGYANGESEREVGRVIKEVGWAREDLIISTKIFFGTGSKEPNGRGLSRKHLVEGTLASLKRLQLDYVDILFAHRPDPTVPLIEVVKAFNHVIDRGLAFYWGTSEWSAAQIAEAQEIADKLSLIGPQVEQPQYNLLHRERFEKEYAPLFDVARGCNRIGSTIWSPLASGFLTGKYNDGIPEDSRYAQNKDFFKNTVEQLKTPEGQARIEKVRKLTEVAKKLGTTPATLSLAWAASNENVTSVILGATKPQQLEENLGAIEILKKLTPEIKEEINNIFQNKPEPVSTYGR